MAASRATDEERATPAPRRLAVWGPRLIVFGILAAVLVWIGAVALRPPALDPSEIEVVFGPSGGGVAWTGSALERYEDGLFLVLELRGDPDAEAGPAREAPAEGFADIAPPSEGRLRFWLLDGEGELLGYADERLEPKALAPGERSRVRLPVREGLAVRRIVVGP